MEEAIDIHVGDPEVLGTSERGARPLYGIDGPRRRPKSEDDVVDLTATETEAGSDPGADVAPALRVRAGVEGMQDRWHEESSWRTVDRSDGGSGATVDGASVAELRRHVDEAVERMQATFVAEIEALRTTNREEAKRFRSANGEAFVRVRVANTEELERLRVANTEELERLRTTIEGGIDRLCRVLDGQLDRIWQANDAELQRIRSIGAERLAEVHDLLSREIEQIRAQQAPEPPHRWFRRKRRPVAR